MSNINKQNSDNAPNSFSTMQEVSTTYVPADPIVTNTPQQVTQWVDDTALQSASLPSPIVPSDNLLAGGEEIREHNIKDVLERPVKLADFTWNDSSVFETNIATYNFPEDLIAASSNIADKITHFTFLRAHVVVRFVVNANTFQAGRLVAYFAPYNTVSEIGLRASVNSYMAAKTAFPRVVLDAGSGNSGELLIPYASYFTHYDLVKGLGDLGQVIVTVLNPLQSGSATVSVFARFVDVQLEIPTAAPNVFGSSTLSSLLKSFVSRFGKKKLDTIIEANMPRAQVGEAVEQAERGVISGALTTVAKYSSMGAGLPFVGRYLTPLSWLADASAQVAKYFGLSKPTNLTQPSRFVQLPGYGFTNTDGTDISTILGASVCNEIGTRNDVFGSAEDEMDIAFIAMHECYLTSFTWASSAEPGTDLLAFNVSPGACKAVDRGGVNMFDSTLMAYVASMFKYWRGSIKIKIQVTKTAYHSGRLRVSYIPGASLPVGTAWDLNQGYSEIVDLRTSDEITLVIPFVSNTIWKPVNLVPFAATGQLPTSTGVVVVEVLNTLRRPTSVAASLQGNVWISAGDDIQFSVPDFQNYMPCIDDATTLAEGIVPYIVDEELTSVSGYTFSDDIPHAQVLGQFQDVGFNSMGSGGDLFKSPRVKPLDAEAVSIGEHIQNLRPLVRRFGLEGSFQINNGAANAIAFNTGYFGNIARSSAPTTSVPFTPIEYISWLYRFYRGGQRFKFIVQNPRVGVVTSFVRHAVDSVPIAPSVVAAAASFWAGILNSGSAFAHITSPLQNFMNEVLVPYYSNTYISLIRNPDMTGGLTTNDDLRSIVYNLYAHTNASTTQNGVSVLRAAADDFSFGWLVGPPRLMPRAINGITSTINFAGVTTMSCNADGTCAAFSVVAITPTAISGSAIISSSVATVSFPLTEGGSISVPLIGAYVGDDTTYLCFPVESGVCDTIDSVGAVAAVVALGSISVVIQPPTLL